MFHEYVNLHVRVHVNVHVLVHVNIHVGVHVRVHVHPHAQEHVNTCKYLNMNMYANIFLIAESQCTYVSQRVKRTIEKNTVASL
jgi:hypothetical protein